MPDERVEEVLAGLDFREKGGYTRAVVDMFPAGGEQSFFEDTGRFRPVVPGVFLPHILEKNRHKYEHSSPISAKSGHN